MIAWMRLARGSVSVRLPAREKHLDTMWIGEDLIDLLR
jgi:hypothetical protein